MSPTSATIPAPITATELPMASDTDETFVLETRFGRLEAASSAAITMPQGPHGFAGYRRYVLANIPGAEDKPFKLFQSLDDHDLTFIVLPVDTRTGPIDPDDIEEAARSHGIAMENLAVLLIVTMRREPGGQVRKTANVRAPLIVDTANRAARQHIFLSNDYPIRQDL